MNANPVLMVLNAGHGTTPACPEARFKAGDIVKVRRLKFLTKGGQLGCIAVVVPPRVSPDHAIADARGEPRPLLATVPRRDVTYIVGFEGDQRPWLMREKYLLPTTEPAGAVTWA